MFPFLGCEPFTNSSINSNNVADVRRSPGTSKQSTEDLMLSLVSQGSSDADKRKAMPGGPIVASSRGKGRPVKSAQNPSTLSGCKPLIQCFTCHKTFNNSSALAKHKLIHSEDRKYSCAICSKSFKRQDHLWVLVYFSHDQPFISLIVCQSLSFYWRWFFNSFEVNGFWSRGGLCLSLVEKESQLNLHDMWLPLAALYSFTCFVVRLSEVIASHWFVNSLTDEKRTNTQCFSATNGQLGLGTRPQK